MTAELDRFELGTDARAFGAWFYRWKRRWIAGESIRMVMDVEATHVRVIADPDARRPSYMPSAVQLDLDL